MERPALERYRFPKGFLWGSSTASYQVEGGIENNDWAEAGRLGRLPSAGTACDHYHLYERDFDLARSLGQNAYRFSLEWSRIEPEEGALDTEALEHYGKVLSALRERNLEPFVTIWHFTLPLWFSGSGGFERDDSPIIFARYAHSVASALREKAKFWITINEPMVWVTDGYLRGKWPPFKRSLRRYLRVIRNLIDAHNAASEAIKSVGGNLLVGVAKNNICYDSNYNPFNRALASFLNWFWNERFLGATAGHLDFIGLNYYMYIKFGGERPTTLTDMGWQINPRGFHRMILQLRKYAKPIYITENGIADATDLMRAAFIKDHVYWMHRAIEDGVDVRGYFYWSLLDNFEWAHGYTKRFGLVEVDYDTMERKVRSSAYEYKRICDENSLI